MRLVFLLHPNYILSYIPSSNLLFCGYEIIMMNDVIYEVIILKIQGLYRAFLRLENREICRVTHAYNQRIHLKLHVVFSDKYCWSNSTRSFGLHSPVLYIVL